MPKHSRARIRELVRHFKENGMKMMLQHPANVRDVLRLADVPWFDEIGFDRIREIKTTFIRRNYRHLQSDIVLTAPLSGSGPAERKLLIYILIEHQSDPDRLMPLRLADSQVQIFRYQVRQWLKTHASEAQIRFSPVLPVVFYTGLQRWPKVGTLADVIERGEEFREVTPIVERPMYLNLPEIPPDQLENKGGYFGWVLRLIQQRHTRIGEFRQLLRNVVAQLEGMETEDRARWLDLLSFVGAMIYHERSEGEHVELHETIEDSVCWEESRREVAKMGRTMADVLIDRGRAEGRAEGRTEGQTEAAIETRQQTLIRLLRRRFGKIPAKVTRAINATTTTQQLDEWLDRFATASSLEEMGF
jgi:predicted transposase YdaD